MDSGMINLVIGEFLAMPMKNFIYKEISYKTENEISFEVQTNISYSVAYSVEWFVFFQVRNKLEKDMQPNGYIL